MVAAALLAAGLASSMAQNVYSLNVVGYVNVTATAGQFTALANPLDATLGGTVLGMNDITNLFATGQSGDYVQQYDPVTLLDYTSPISVGRHGWSSNLPLPPGGAVMYYNNQGADEVFTFVGQVQQGTYNNGTLTGGQLNLVGMPVPLDGGQTNLQTAGLVSSSGDYVQTYNTTTPLDWSSPAQYSSRGAGSWSGQLEVAPGQGFFYYNNSSDNVWTSNFTVQ